MAERIETDLWRLDIPLVGNPLKNLNSYLLTGERSLLIDTGGGPVNSLVSASPALT